jgi:hypothetical protein
MRCLLFAAGLAAVLAAPGRATADMYMIIAHDTCDDHGARGELPLCVTSWGELVFVGGPSPVRAASDLWTLTAGPEPTRVQVHRGRRDIGYDRDGKDHRVRLVFSPGPEWETTLVKGGGPHDYTFRVAKGKLAGWYLAVGPAFEVKDDEGKPRTAYRAVLVKKPKKPLALGVYVIAP